MNQLNDKCLTCAKRLMLLDARFQLECRTNAANVHELANAKQCVDGALELVRWGRCDCERCERCLIKAREHNA